MWVNCVYHTWFERIRQQRPEERVTRLRNFAWIAAGVLGSRSVHLSRIAEKIPGGATTVSKMRRVRRFLNNIFIERFWRSLKYEDITLRDYATVSNLEAGPQRYFAFYNHERPHQSLNYAVPGKVHQGMVTLVR